MFKIRKSITTTLLATALLAITPQAYALTATELQEKLQKDVELPFSMGLLGPLKNAKVSVEGEGPFNVTITDATIDGSPIPAISFQVEDGAEAYKVNDAIVDGDVVVDLAGQATITISNLGWSGTWNIEQDDFTEFNYASSGIGLSLNGLPGKLSFGESSSTTSYSKTDGEQNSSAKISGFDLDFDGTGLGQEVGKISYQIGGMETNSTVKISNAVPQFKLLKSIAHVALKDTESMADAAKRKAFLLSIVDSLFVPVDSFTSNAVMTDLANTQGNPEFTYTVNIDETKSTTSYGASNKDGTFEVVSDSEASGYAVNLTSENPMLAAQADLKLVETDVVVGDLEPARLKSALIEMIETGNDNPENISVSAVMEALFAFGGVTANYDGTGLTIQHPMMGEVFSAEKFGLTLDLNSTRGDDRYSGEGISFNGLSVPAVAMANLPARIVPENISLSFGLGHSPIPYYVDEVGRDNISDMIKGKLRPEAHVMENLNELLEAFNTGTFAPEMRIALSGEGYDFSIGSNFEVDASFDPSKGPLPDVKGTLVVKGLDGLKAFIIGLSPDLSEDMQTAVFGAIGAIGFVESMGQIQDDGSLIYNIEMTSLEEVSINGNPFPIPR
ncbi:MAG: hypothetical protein ACPGVN_03360 [Alphaproteobacteria bacterium]